MTQTTEIAALILAAGQSRRMGAFKPLLPFGAQTVIESCISNFQAAGIRDVIVVLGHRADELRKALADYPVSLTTNPDSKSEMSASIAAGVKQIKPDVRALLITPADHPAVPPPIIKLLVECWRSGARLVQPEYQGQGGHPVLIDLTYREELLALDPNRGLRGLFDAHRNEVKRFPVDSPYVARDLDTWEDYLSLHVDVFGVPPAQIQRLSWDPGAIEK